ncbi:hypothetical protein IWQ60_003207 [Tieghemiomyces parasiticus]|uniref:Uncharacterized protein n=1 Tax=Tieghemiomyces parasiticus TaxID=78921 RepID=A0A9W8E0X2_9FUNG|nr:hypothetical protein IWQ60_003207 [Tieghemiomyces parasiticus]
MTRWTREIGDMKPSLVPYGECQSESSRTGLVAGVTGGFLGGYISNVLFKLPRNNSILAGVVTGSLVGWLFANQAMKECMKRNHLSDKPTMPQSTPTTLEDVLSSGDEKSSPK